ncbi:MAG: ABC transporter permease [Acidobacteria bacterium]|nr:ABC transporter permease [Acidobacteriota bacterium]
MRKNVIKAIIKKEFYQIFRDKRTLALTFALPLMMMVIFSYGIRFDVDSIRVAIADQSDTVQSRDLISGFLSSGYFMRIDNNLSPSEAKKMLLQGDVAVAMIIPPDFASNLKRGRTNPVQFILDGVDSNTANISQGYIKAITLQYNSKLILSKIKAMMKMKGLQYPPLNLSLRVLYNPELRSNNFIIPGIIVIIMMLMGAILTSLSIVKEKELGSFENIISSPVKSSEFIIGKIAPYTILAFADMLLIILVGWIVFNVPIKGSIPLLLLISLIYLVSTLGIGILISTIAQTQQVALLGAMVATFLPSIFFSGFVFPISNMPIFLQWLSMIVPARYFMNIVRTIYLKGTGLTTFWLDLVMLSLLAILLLLLSAKKFKKSLD